MTELFLDILKQKERARALRDDLLTGVAEIADYTGQPKRRILHLIEAHGLPVFRRGRVIHARKHQVDSYFGGAGTQPAAEHGVGQ